MFQKCNYLFCVNYYFYPIVSPVCMVPEFSPDWSVKAGEQVDQRPSSVWIRKQSHVVSVNTAKASAQLILKATTHCRNIIQDDIYIKKNNKKTTNAGHRTPSSSTITLTRLPLG